MNNFVKQAYVQGLAARAILRARIMQKRAGIGDYALAGGVGAGGGALIGALVNYARKKNMLHGALAGAGIGGVAGLGYQGIKDLLSDPLADLARFNASGKQNTPKGYAQQRRMINNIVQNDPELAADRKILNEQHSSAPDVIPSGPAGGVAFENVLPTDLNPVEEGDDGYVYDINGNRKGERGKYQRQGKEHLYTRGGAKII